MRRIALRPLVASLFALALLAAAPARPPVALDRLLDETPAPTLDAYRLFTDVGAQTPNLGVTPYGLNTPLFTDYALKQRYLYLPPGAKAGYRSVGVLDLPVGAVLIKTFAYPADFRRANENVRKVETRLLIHRKSGWVALPYVWNAEQTQAVLKRAGLRREVDFVDAHGQARRLDYAVPNANQCKECHSQAGVMTPIGPKARNLNGDYPYAEGTENQLVHLAHKGLLTGAPAPKAVPRTVVWTDQRETLEARARAYLDVNCGHCHSPTGAASNTGLFLEQEEARLPMVGVGKRPVATGRASGGLLFDIAPGDPDGSIVVHRMASTEPGVMMPELGRSTVHEEGLALVRAYVASLKK